MLFLQRQLQKNVYAIKSNITSKKSQNQARKVSKDGGGTLLFSLTVLFYRMFQCTLCSRVFSTLQAMREHCQVVHCFILYK